ncbi:hypothetical protein SAMN04489810_0575 [Microbacterium pygmaeum]|uniref:Uncharacterized protein n=1 Tax=Microbacterium pygmaeum TaxID=370764 RepID=A0A1G7V295_9MICO|nr:hypothetical protein SAMN04489810_0575 [Microbacterium pygmaeum]
MSNELDMNWLRFLFAVGERLQQHHEQAQHDELP